MNWRKILIFLPLLLLLSAGERAVADAPRQGTIQPSDTPILQAAQYPRYLGILSAGILANAVIEGSGHTLFSIRTVQGIVVNDRLSVGLGVGFEGFPSVGVVPLFLDCRLYLLAEECTPFVLVDVGQSFLTREVTAGSITSGGSLLGVGGGLRVPLSKTSSFLIELGYERQETQGTMDTFVFNSQSGFAWPTLLRYDHTYDLFKATVGIGF